MSPTETLGMYKALTCIQQLQQIYHLLGFNNEMPCSRYDMERFIVEAWGEKEGGEEGRPIGTERGRVRVRDSQGDRSAPL